MIYKGTDPFKGLHIGNRNIQSVYAGNAKVWPAGGPGPDDPISPLAYPDCTLYFNWRDNISPEPYTVIPNRVTQYAGNTLTFTKSVVTDPVLGISLANNIGTVNAGGGSTQVFSGTARKGTLVFAVTYGQSTVQRFCIFSIDGRAGLGSNGTATASSYPLIATLPWNSGSFNRVETTEMSVSGSPLPMPCAIVKTNNEDRAVFFTNGFKKTNFNQITDTALVTPGGMRIGGTSATSGAEIGTVWYLRGLASFTEPKTDEEIFRIIEGMNQNL